jgi:tetratricopeptide (TPR) repeat protein
MNMKKIILSIVCAFGFALPTLRAQNCEIPLMVAIQEDTESIPEAALQYLKDKLVQIAAQDGITANAYYTQFMITAKVTELTKDIVPGTPVNISQTLNVSFYIIDYFGEKVLTTGNLEIQAVGTNQTKAYINAIRNINVNNKNVKELIQKGKEKIIAYYDANYTYIIEKAKKMADMKQFEEALFYLISVPECSKGYKTAIASCSDVYHGYINELCRTNLNMAKSIWYAGQNVESAREAGLYLSEIYPDANCYNEAMDLFKEIKNRVREDWTFKMKQYDDSVSLEKQRIDAYKQVGVAFGNGQQPTTTNIGRLY